MNEIYSPPLEAATVAPPVPDETPATGTLAQLQQRLTSLTLQLDRIQSHLNQMADENQLNASQLTVLLQQITTVSPVMLVEDRLAELITQFQDQQAKLGALADLVAQGTRQEQLTQLGQHLTELVEQTASQTQMAELTESIAQIANQDQVANLEDALKKLSRTQFKANTLGESKEQQISNALSTLQELVSRREQVQERVKLRERQQIAEAQEDARAGMAAELLPALDSIELALEHGRLLLVREQAKLDEAIRASIVAAQAVAQLPPSPTPEPTFWQRWLRPRNQPPALPMLSSASQSSALVPDPALAQQTFASLQEGLTAWLRGLELVRARFVALLTAEGIQAIDALHQPFDPHLHVAVESEARSDVASNTVVRVMRKGYRQQQRILRYVEVVVAHNNSQPADAQVEQPVNDIAGEFASS